MGTVKVASIYFAPVIAHRFFRGAPYKIPAVAHDADPAILEVRDLVQRDWGPMIPGTNKRQELRWVVTGEEIARDIVGEWTGNTVGALGMNPQCHPGIWIVRENLPVVEKHGRMINNEMTYEERMVLDAESKQVFRAATAEEQRAMWDEDMAAARAADKAYAEWCFNEGNNLYAKQQRGEEFVLKEVPRLYKLAAKHYGLEAEWLKEAVVSSTTVCPHCEKTVSKTAMICKFCTQPIDLKRWAKWQAEKDKALLDAQTAPEVPAEILAEAATGKGISSRVRTA